MGKDGDENFLRHESNVQTWVSAALTDATTCINGILGDGISEREKNFDPSKDLEGKATY